MILHPYLLRHLHDAFFHLLKGCPVVLQSKGDVLAYRETYELCIGILKHRSDSL